LQGLRGDGNYFLGSLLIQIVRFVDLHGFSL
jgi:hypothetical protein